jgi:hypothetical protein
VGGGGGGGQHKSRTKLEKMINQCETNHLGANKHYISRKMKRDIITVDDPLIPPKDNHQITNN